MSLKQAWNDYDGETLARLISFDDRHARNSKFHKDDDPSDAVERALEEPIDDIVSDHLRAVYQGITYLFEMDPKHLPHKVYTKFGSVINRDL